MNLIRISLENFKQYVDPLVIEIPQQATIGVIGTNGVGKTTLFQAIEWCLYNPTSIAGRDIRPRGRSGNPKVTVTLESRDRSQRWMVERELKRSSTTAVVYEIDTDGNEKMIVQGTREVTEFVSTRLIDLSHKAFIATFFTRQKELHFFGDMRDTDRRREVGKLLGLETIRRAQIMIGEERTTANREAQLLHKQYAAETGERDLEAEQAQAEQSVIAAEAERVAAMDAEAVATEASARAKAQLASTQALRDREREVRNRYDRAQADLNETSRRRQQRDDEIVRLETAKFECDRLRPIAATLPRLQDQVRQADVERQRFQRKAELERNLASSGQRRESTIGQLASEVRENSSQRADPDWTWTDSDGTNVPAAIERLRWVSTARPVSQSEIHHIALLAAKAAHEQVVHARSKLETYLTARNGLVAEQKAALTDGNPESILTSIAERSTSIKQALVAWDTERKAIETDLGKRQRVLTNIRNANFDDGCPTCGRKFSEHDEHDISELFASDIAAMHERILIGDRDSSVLADELKSMDTVREAQMARQELLRKIEARLARSVGFIEEQKQTVGRLQEDAAVSLKKAGISNAPSDADIDTAARQLNLARVLSESLGRIQIHAATVADLDAARQTIETDLTSFADVRFDEAAFSSLVAERDAAATAATRIEGFDRELLQFPIAIEDRNALIASIVTIEQRTAEIKRELFQLGYDPELLQVAERAVAEAEQTERGAVGQHQQTQLSLQKVTSTRESLAREHDRIRRIVSRADARQREADDLNQMYSLFGEFEQFVVSRLTPTLSELTSDLVRQVTDGKYDDVSFDDNFGVLVRDGDESPFPLATFSGGERDAIALCARLALSQMIGLQATEQPGFLVLDEVFGSLDRDRRSRLLDLFGNLSTISDRFQQVFIISHVDDVRTAPIFDELWMVEEREDGKSTISSLAPGTDIGEL